MVPPTFLELEAADLVRKLGGVWRPGGGMCRCPVHEDKEPSLSVRVGSKSLLFKCFAGCSGVEILRALRRRRHRVPSLRGGEAEPERHVDPAPMLHRARSIWDAAHPIEGTRGAQYLLGRGIPVLSEALRYHPGTPFGRGSLVRFRPAIVAALSDASGFVAIQRIFLDRCSPVLATDLPKPKLTLARPMAGAVRLARPGPVLGLAEGIETALSASFLLGIPVWATLGSERLARIELPREIERLILLPDFDNPGRLAERRARNAYARHGLSIGTLWPWGGRNDWNDVLREEGRGRRLLCGERPDWRAAPHQEQDHEPPDPLCAGGQLFGVVTQCSQEQ